MGSVERPSSADVYRGFCALRDVMSFTVDRQSSASTHPAEVDGENTSDDQVVPSKLVSSGRHISSIVEPVFRLEIMEDIFSLLFSRSEHLRDSEDSPECQSDSDPENRDDPKRPGFVFDTPVVNCENISDFSDAHEIPPLENPRVEALTAESRHSPLEASSSSVDGRSDEYSGSQTVSNSSVKCGSESGFLARGHVIREVLILLHICCEKLSSELAAGNVNSVRGDGQTADSQLTVLRRRVEALLEHVRDAQWRLRITVPTSAGVASSSKQSQLKQRRQRSRRHRDSVSKDSDTYSATSDNAHTENTVVPKMLCRPESLLNLCLAEGRITDAEEVVKVSHLVSTELIILVNIETSLSCVLTSTSMVTNGCPVQAPGAV